MINPVNIFLIGLMGSGKTSVGHYLAQKLALPFFDSDQEIVKALGQSIPDLFAQQGEKVFRAKETEVIATLTQCHPIILATGGGAILMPENRYALANRGKVIYLYAPISVLINRTQGDTNRPLLLQQNSEQVFIELLQQREAFYQETAHFSYDSSQSFVSELGNNIIQALQKEGYFI